MSLSVDITCGIAWWLLPDGHPVLNNLDVRAPYTKGTCDPTRKILEKEGVKVDEERSPELYCVYEYPGDAAVGTLRVVKTRSTLTATEIA